MPRPAQPSERRRRHRSQGHGAFVHSSAYPCSHLGLRVLALDHYELVYSKMGVVYGAGFTADHVTRIRAMDHARHVGGRLRFAGCSTCFVRSARALLIGCGVYVGIYGVALVVISAVVSEVRCGSERIGVRNALPQELHRIYSQSYDLSDIAGNLISRHGRPDPGGAGPQPGHDREYSSVGRSAAVANL